MKRRVFLLALMLVIISVAAAHAGLAPLNPAFRQWKAQQADIKASSSCSAQKATGYVPGPVDLSHLAKNPPVIAAIDTLPVSYDLRKLGRVTRIRDQEMWGTCWAFAAISSVESNYLTRTLNGEVNGSLGSAESLDLSELHMAWFARNHPYKDKVNTATPFARYETNIKSIEGGLSSISLAYLAALEGPVLESSLPYLSYEALSNDAGYLRKEIDALIQLGALPSYTELLAKGYVRSGKFLVPRKSDMPEDYGVVLRLTDALFGTPAPAIGAKDRTDIDDNDKAKYPNFDYIKRLIIEHGALSIGYHSMGGAEEYINAEHHAYSYRGDDYNMSNHAVAIIGWDDNFSRMNFNENYRPSTDGAWLVRNNWGAFEPLFDDGYFWMSYEQPFDDGLAHIVEDLPENLGCYQYDPLGWCNAFGFENSREAWIANTFRITTNGEEVESIAFYTTDNNASVEWAVYSLGTVRPAEAPYNSANIPSRQGRVTFPYAGYHTVKLDERLPVAKGNYFSVVLKITNSEHGYPAAVEMRVDGYSDFANVHDGESWFSYDGLDWWDGTENLAYVGNDRTTLHHVPMNACIKAFTQDFNLADNDSSEEDSTPVYVLGIPLKKYLAVSIDASSVNSIKDFPYDEITINLPDKDNNPLPESTDVRFYLVNRTEEHEFTLSYSEENVDGNSLGLAPRVKEIMFDPIFYPGYEPDEFWKAENHLEFPVYGPFVGSVNAEGELYLDVNALMYAESPDVRGAVHGGYYDFVYLTDDGAGSLSVRLNDTDIDEANTNSQSVGGSSGGCESVSITCLALAVTALLRLKNYRR